MKLQITQSLDRKKKDYSLFNPLPFFCAFAAIQSHVIVIYWFFLTVSFDVKQIEKHFLKVARKINAVEVWTR